MGQELIGLHTFSKLDDIDYVTANELTQITMILHRASKYNIITKIYIMNDFNKFQIICLKCLATISIYFSICLWDYNKAVISLFYYNADNYSCF